MRRALARVALLVASLGGALGLAELGARLAQPQPAEDLLAEAPETAPPELYAPDPAVLMHPVANYSGWSGRGVYVRTDSLGCRGAEPASPEPGWVMVGDSFTMAVQVDEEDTFSARLARTLGQPVFNCGADGWTVHQAALRVQEVGKARALAGAVYVLFTGNDATEALLYQSLARLSRDAQGVPMLPAPPRAAPAGASHPPPGLFSRLRRQSVLWSAWEVSRRRLRVAKGDYPEVARFREEFSLFTTVEPQRHEPAWRALSDGLGALRQRTAGLKLVVAVAPPVYAVDPERGAASAQVLGLDPATLALGAPQARALAILDTLGIATCDLGPALQAARPAVEPYLRYDGHWSVAGHQIVADTIAACVRQDTR